jgi:acyl dehydratase
MHQSALLATFATDWLGAANVRRFGVRFRDQVWPGDVLTCTGTVSAITAHSDNEDLITVELLCARQTGDVAIAGSADFVVARSSL